MLTYYRDVHGRDGFDDAGSEVVSVVHAGIQYGNAAWVQGMDFMMYGDGDGELMGDMTTGVDVAGHELTHGVTAKTAKLTMMDQTGALNEAYSDFFGKMIAKDGNWVIGASLSLDHTKFPGIRDLANPHSLNDTYYDGAGNQVTKVYPAKGQRSGEDSADHDLRCRQRPVLGSLQLDCPKPCFLPDLQCDRRGQGPGSLLPDADSVSQLRSQFRQSGASDDVCLPS